MDNAADRFTKTVEDYVKYRPSYPPDIIDLLIAECGLTKNSIIADVGSGTGLLARLFLEFGNSVYGIEPNEKMREAGENFLKKYPKFQSIIGSAEATTLKMDSCNFITAGTAFHWFDASKSKVEFKRILTHPGWVVLIWNVRNTEQSSLMKDYENLIMTYGKDYRSSRAERFDQSIVNDFFAPFAMKTAAFKNTQQFDWQGMKGRLLSTSYSLRPGDAKYEEMIQSLKDIFVRYNENDKVVFSYMTKIYYGRLK